MMDLFKKKKKKTLHVAAEPNPGLWRGWCFSLHCRLGHTELFTEHPLRARQVLNAEDTEVSETGYNWKAARHLPIKVCARCHISRRWGWNSQWEI